MLEMLDKKSLFIKLLLTFLVLWGMVFFGRIGVADFLLLAPRAYVDEIQAGKVRFDPVELIHARERLLVARSWDKHNPTVHEYLGHIAFMRAQFFSSVPVVQAAFLREAAEDFDAAILNRPNSGILWADRMVIASEYLAVLAATRGDTALMDRERVMMSRALHRAAVLSPWDPAVLQPLSRVSARRYGEFAVGEQRVLDAVLARAKQLNLQL